MRQYIAQ